MDKNAAMAAIRRRGFISKAFAVVAMTIVAATTVASEARAGRFGGMGRSLILLNLSNTFERYTVVKSLSYIYEIYKEGDHEPINDAWSGGEEHEAVFNIRMFMKKNGNAAWTVWHTLENLRDTATDPGE